VGVVIRALADEDIDEVVGFSLRAWAPVFESFRGVLGDEIYERIYPDWRESQARDVAGICRGNLDSTWVAEVAGHPVGFVVVIFDRAAFSAEIEMLAVDPGHQRQGIAAGLMGFALDRMRAAGVRVVAVSTGGDPGHAPARKAYERAGFTPLPLVRYYQALVQGGASERPSAG
jgi:GNAT superfamily N-acetyltransferase